MTAQDLLTVGHLQEFKTQLTGLLEELRPALANANDRYLEVNEITEYTSHGRSTVLNWIKYGKRDRFGNIFKLEAEEFSPGQYRVLRSKLIDFGKIKDCVAVTPERKNKAA
ncbi:MAG: hypothetical protein ACO1OF_16295 [Adhaeribacter sp.]